MEDEEKTTQDKTKNKLQWLMVCENVAEVERCKLSEVFDLSITEFLNMVGYVNWKNVELEKKYKK